MGAHVPHHPSHAPHQAGMYELEARLIMARINYMFNLFFIKNDESSTAKRCKALKNPKLGKPYYRTLEGTKRNRDIHKYIK